MGRQRRVTLADVAARAGVSSSTASLAYSGAGPVAEPTRQRVLAAAAELGYAGPDPLARSLRQGRTGVVGVVIGERLLDAFRDPVSVALLDGISAELTPLGSALLLLPGDTRAAGQPPERVALYPLDAMVFAGCDDEHPLIAHVLARRVPAVAVEGPRRPELPIVDIDHLGGSRQAAEHLLQLGHREIAVVSLPLTADTRRGPVDPARRAACTFALCRDRLRAVEEVLGPTVRIVETASNLVEEGELAGAELFESSPRPTAVIAQADLLAIGVIRAAAKAGLRVPEDLSVVGFDGIDSSGWLGSEQLTTVEQPMYEKGHVAGRMVAELVAGRRPADVTLPVTFRVGATTAPPAA
ncbi:MAG TPA: LacI family DNA-binding transcriptional regulator [Natronosporangium sp.]